jgi:hypothetical protein
MATIKSAVEKITPEIATKLIEDSKDIRNRNVSDGHVKWLADQMKSGKWVLNGEAIILDDEGQIVDGQHRLWAVIQSETAIESLVTRGVDRKGFATIDTGAARTAANVLAIVGKKDANALGAALSLIHRHEVGQMLAHGKDAGFTTATGLAILRRHPEIEESVEFVSKHSRTNVALRKIPRSAFIFLHYRFSAHAKEKAVEFFEQVGDVRFDTTGTITRLLRDFLLRRDALGGGIRALELCAIVVKAWRAFLENRPASRQTLQWKRGGEYPEGFPQFPGESESTGKALRIIRRTKKRGTG